MYASSYFLILITALSAGALAVPTDMNHMLHVRGDPQGSVAGYRDDHCCDGPVLGVSASDGTTVLAKPVDDHKHNCITFNTPAPYLGINFGSTLSMIGYSSPHCVDASAITFVAWPNNQESGGSYDEYSSVNITDGKYNCAKRCVNQQSYFKGPISSVRFLDEKVPY